MLIYTKFSLTSHARV